MKYLIIALVVLGGVGIPIQVAANNRLRDAVGSPALAITLAFAVGTLGMAALTVSGVLGRGHLGAVASAPWWAWVGGLLSAFVVVVSTVGLPKAGAGAIIAATIFGQITAAIVIDHFGWMGVERRPITFWRMGAALLMLGGALLMQKK